ncbi:MAG TPA: TAXI family TRAP transporter solute-binding subunit [Rubrivivax sp.]
MNQVPASSPPPLRVSWSHRWRLALVNAGPAAAVLLLAGVCALLYLAYRALDPTPPKRLVIATGPEQGAYSNFGRLYRPLLQAHGLEIELRTTRGSAENLALLRDPTSGVHAAFVQGGVDLPGEPTSQPGPAADTPPALVSLGQVAPEPLWLFYRQDSARRLLRGAAPVNLAQMVGWRVDTGPVGGGSGPLFRQLAEANGLPPTALQRGEGVAVNGVVDLVSGTVDALVMVSAADAPLLQYLLQTPGVQLFDFAQSEAYARRFTFLRPVVLPRGVIDLARDKPPRDVRLVAATASLVARADLHPALVQLLLQAASEVHRDPGWFHRSGEFPSGTSNAAGIPLAREAERYYHDGPPWLQRYLPFWLANFIDRMWIVLLPLLAAAIPLSRVVPPLVTLRVRSRVFRWYSHLRAVESALEQPAPDLTQLRAELERIDAQTERIQMPLAYTHELYELRSHIQLVRKRLLARAAGPGAQ